MVSNIALRFFNVRMHLNHLSDYKLLSPRLESNGFPCNKVVIFLEVCYLLHFRYRYYLEIANPNCIRIIYKIKNIIIVHKDMLNDYYDFCKIANISKIICPIFISKASY